MELIARCRGNNDFAVFYRKGETVFDFIANNRERWYKVSFEYDSNTDTRLPFKEKSKAFKVMFDEFMKDQHNPSELSLGIKGAIGNIITDVTKKYGFRVLNVRKLAPEEGSILETHIFVLTRRK